MRRAATAFALTILAAIAGLTSGAARAADAEQVLEQHMVAEALLAAHLVAVAEHAGMSADEIRAILKDVAERSAIDEFWITDETGRAYLTNEDVDFTFLPDPEKQPQASAFWPLIQGTQQVVTQKAQKREIDDRVFKYVGVAGVDKPRIVQVGVGAENLPDAD